MKRRKAVILALAAIGLALAAAAGIVCLHNQKSRAVAAQQDLEECRCLAARITELGRRPEVAAREERSSAEITGLVERAASGARLPQGGLLRISPEPAQRVGDTVYKERPVRVVLRRLPLKHLVEFLHTLAASDATLRLPSLHLRTARVEAVDAWDAEVVVSYLVVDPPKSP